MGDYASTPAIFLTLFFFVVAFASYKFGQFPASQIPFAYYLVGFTTIAVSTYGVADPAQVWQTGLNRALEIMDFKARLANHNAFLMSLTRLFISRSTSAGAK